MPPKGLRELATEALGRLGVETVPTRLEEAYNAGTRHRCRLAASSASAGGCAARSATMGALSFERAGPAPR